MIATTSASTRYFRLKDDYKLIADKLTEKGISFTRQQESDHIRFVVAEADFPAARFLIQQYTNPHKKTKILQLKQMYKD